jgi:hypothetical protein
MPPSLLADLATLLARSPEDVATEALVLILNRSPSALAAMNRQLLGWAMDHLEPIARWRTQVVGSDEARTDAEGKDAAGRLQVIIESKFWAGLTPNQPLTYLARLKEPHGIVLFVVPESRIGVLALELTERLPDELPPVGFQTRGLARVAQLGAGQSVVLVGWGTLLATLTEAAYFARC